MNNIIVTQFNVTSEAYQAFTELKKTAPSKEFLISQMVLLEKHEGKISQKDAFDSGAETSDDTVMGGLIGSIVGILGGPLGVLLGFSFGTAAGSVVDMSDISDSNSLLDTVAKKMKEGSTAIILLAQEGDNSIYNALAKKYASETVRWDAAVIQEEVDQAAKAQREVEKAARKAKIKSFSDESKARVEGFGKKIEDEFTEMKNKLTKKD